MVRTATKKDASRISEIHIFGWRSAYRGIIPDTYLFSEISVTGRYNSFIEKKEDESDDVFVFEEHDIIKGFMKVGTCRDEDKNTSFELWGIYVEPLMKNEGIGSKLIQYCENLAIGKGFSENVIWVLEDNTDSRKFYEKHGYKADGKELVMSKFNVKEVRYSKILK